MLIGICGSICAGRSTVAQYLVSHHGFKRLEIRKPAQEGQDGPSAANGSGDQKAAAKTTGQPLSFSDADELLDFVTKRWRERWVTVVTTVAVLDLLARRPFFLLISVDAPVTTRWKRLSQWLEKEGGGRADRDHFADATADAAADLSEFVRWSDDQMYDDSTGSMALMSRAAVHMLNTSPDVAHLYATLGKVDLTNEDRLRPSWDAYFMSLASLAAHRSNCMKRRVGCVLVRGRRVVSTGYNGTPRGLRNCGEGGCPRCNEGAGSGVGLSTCLCLHAEENALLEAGRDRIGDGSVLYCDTCPCLTCSIKIAQVGIGEVVYSQGYSMDGDTAAVLREAGVKLRQYVPPANGLIHLERTELY
ncbi:hypothetical protein RB601_009044 [Gaeumannomyces tritici]